MQNVFTAYESTDTLVETSQLEALFASMPLIADRANVDAIADESVTLDFSQFWTEQSWGNALNAANHAELIIVSVSGRNSLPMPVQRWMESWPQYQSPARATLALVFASEPANCPAQAALISYFQKIAQAHGLEFVCNRTKTSKAAKLPGFAAN